MRVNDSGGGIKPMKPPTSKHGTACFLDLRRKRQKFINLTKFHRDLDEIYINFYDLPCSKADNYRGERKSCGDTDITCAVTFCWTREKLWTRVVEHYAVRRQGQAGLLASWFAVWRDAR